MWQVPGRGLQVEPGVGAAQGHGNLLMVATRGSRWVSRGENPGCVPWAGNGLVCLGSGQKVCLFPQGPLELLWATPVTFRMTGFQSWGCGNRFQMQTSVPRQGGPVPAPCDSCCSLPAPPPHLIPIPLMWCEAQVLICILVLAEHKGQARREHPAVTAVLGVPPAQPLPRSTVNPKSGLP